MTLKMVVAILNKEDAKDYVQAYQKAYNRDPIDVDIKDHLEHGAQPDEVCWLKPFETFKVCELFLKGVMLVDLVHASKYNWVDAKIVGNLYVLCTQVEVNVANIVVGCLFDWSILPVDPEQRIRNTFVGCSFPFTSVYSPI